MAEDVNRTYAAARDAVVDDPDERTRRRRVRMWIADNALDRCARLTPDQAVDLSERLSEFVLRD
jgi:hypothetical protein